MRSVTDEQFTDWSIGLRQGDRAAYTAVFDATYDALLNYAFYITRDREAAGDVLQDVYLKLWQVHTTIDPARSLRSLLYQMVRNYALNHQRHKKRHATDPLEEAAVTASAESAADTILEAASLQAYLEACIDELPPRRREAFVLSRYEGLSHDEIARLMSLTSKTVNNHIVLALQHLRARLQAYEAPLQR